MKMAGKKSSTIALVALITFATGWALFTAYRDIKRGENFQNYNLSSGNKSGETDQAEKTEKGPTTFDIETAEGTVVKVEGEKLTLETGNGQTTINVTSDHVVSLAEGDNQEAVELADLKEGTKVKVAYEGPVTPENNYIASGTDQGSVKAVDGNRMTVEAESGEKTFEIIPSTSIYFSKDEQVEDGQASDLREGSLVTVAYSEGEERTVAVAIRIDKQ